MRRTVAVAVAVLTSLGGVAGAPAAGAASALPALHRDGDAVRAVVGTAGVRLLGQPAADDLSWIDQALDAELATAEPAGAPAPDESRRNSPYLRRVGDLDGDGGADTVSVGSTTVEPDATGDATDGLVVARSGRDGAELWYTTFDDAVVLTSAFTLADGSDGVLVVLERRLATSGFGSGSPSYWEATTRQLTLVAFAGDGQVAWEHALPEGSVVRAYATPDGERGVSRFDAYPAFGGVLDSSAGPSAVLVNTIDRVETADIIDSTTTVRVVGADGITLGEHAIEAPDARPLAVAGPDLDGDGRADVVVLAPGTGEAAGLSALSGADAAPLWTTATEELPVFARLAPAGDLDGDATSDLLVRGSDSPVITTIGGIGPLFDFLAFDGATGTKRFTYPATAAYALGDANGDGTDEVGFQTLLSNQGEALLFYDAVGADGRAVWSSEFSVATQAPGTSVTLRPDIGDVDGDGAAEAAHELIGTTTDRAIVDGANGSVVRDELPGLVVGELTSRGGAEFAEVAYAGDTATVTLQDGATGAALWTSGPVTVGAGDDQRYVTASVADVDADGVGDLLMTLATGTSTASPTGGASLEYDYVGAVISGADGAVLWQI